MTELAEGVALGTVKESDLDCPFHDPAHQHDGEKNVLEGNASTLGDALVDGSVATSTVVRKSAPDNRYLRTLRQGADPDARPEDQREIQLIDRNEDSWYPTGFQAHHLIPAQESLARAKQLTPFIKRGSRLCCNLGYDVNGNQNGAWLPGKHAVDGNGLDLWKGRSKPGPDKEGKPRKVTSRGQGKNKWSYIELKGHRPGHHPDAFKDTNMRWLYVEKSMHALGTRQFHDRHPHYSGLVKDHLDSLGAVLERLSGTGAKPAACDKCAQQDGRRQPPTALLGALNGLSNHYHDFVVGKDHHSDFYTSSWCNSSYRAGIAKSRKRVSAKR